MAAARRAVTAAIVSSTPPRSVKSRRKELPVPSGRNASCAPPFVATGTRPFTISHAVPSPPTARKRRMPRPYATRASSVAWRGRAVTSASSGMPLARIDPARGWPAGRSGRGRPPG
jgi:hypothetical protein